MTNILGTGIFWTTLAAIAAILSLATLIGRAWGMFFPYRFKAVARFYLAPALGLATLTIIASLVGRFLPMGDSVVVPCLVIALLIWVLVREKQINRAFRHALMVSVFGIVCGTSILGPLFTYGGFNAHTDAFTYLAHGDWLQHHAFGDTIPIDRVTPLTTQISLYQQASLRMGASFLLALLQALLNLRWSYEIYPAVVIAVIAACCLAIGFPLARVLQSMPRGIRLALLALPAFSLGGLLFGANMGFLPQTVGLALGAGVLFMVGPLFQWVTTAKTNWLAIGKAAIPGAVLFTGASFAYSEIAPFLLVAVLGSGFILAVRFHAWKNLLVHVGLLLGLSILLLNTELIRVYAALRMQSRAVVGGAVDWTLLGYVAHAFGLHGGTWDGFHGADWEGFQWTTPENIGSRSFVFGLILFGLAIGAVLAGVRSVWRTTIRGILMPAAIILIIFAFGILYFRYFVPSPFPKGIGQSWSQFKLAEWAHPFVMAFVLLAVAGLRLRWGKLFNSAVLALFTIGLVSATLIGVARVQPLMHYYHGVSDLSRFYLKFRDTVFATCPRSTPVYLALGGPHHKFRQMAVLYLYDREVASDWMDDDYIRNVLPVERRTQELTTGSCVVEPLGQNSSLNQGTIIGPFQVGIFNGRGYIQIASMSGAHDRESDGQNWWHWVERRVSFTLQPRFAPKDATQTKLRFEYGTRGKQTLALRIIKRDGSSQKILLTSNDDARAVFDQVIDVPPIELAEISIETDGKASPLGERDPRMAAWMICNMTIGIIDIRGEIRIASVSGAYGRESDGQNWWHWVERKVSF
ncbi:MAG: hypothetical protein ACYDHW_01710, partial [Syntrophorhabdaceae bacterium]